MPGQGTLREGLRTLGERLRAVRLEKGLTQAQLGWPDLSDSYVSLIESGKRMPTPQTVRLLARRVGCSPEFLTSGVDAATVERLRTTIGYAEIALENGEAAEAFARYDEALATPELAALPELEATARWGHALAQEARGDLEAAIGELQDIVAKISPATDPDRFAEAHIALCRCRRERGDFDEAAAEGDRALLLLTAEGRWSDTGIKLAVTLLSVYLCRGDLTYARYLADHLIVRAEDLGTPTAMMAAYWEAAIVAEESGRADEALRPAERALALVGEGEDDRNLRRMRWVYARLLFKARPGEAARARDMLAESARRLAEGAVSTVDRAWCLTDLARAELHLGRAAEAAAAAQEAVDLLTGAPRQVTAAALTTLAEACLRLGEADRAGGLLADAEAALGQVGTSREAAQGWRHLADALARSGRTDRQSSALQNALACVNL